MKVLPLSVGTSRATINCGHEVDKVNPQQCPGLLVGSGVWFHIDDHIQISGGHLVRRAHLRWRDVDAFRFRCRREFERKAYAHLRMR